MQYVPPPTLTSDKSNGTSASVCSVDQAPPASCRLSPFEGGSTDLVTSNPENTPEKVASPSGPSSQASYSLPGSRKTSSTQQQASLSSLSSQQTGSAHGGVLPVASPTLTSPTGESENRVQYRPSDLLSRRKVSGSGSDLGMNGKYSSIEKTSLVSADDVEPWPLESDTLSAFLYFLFDCKYSSYVVHVWVCKFDNCSPV